MTAAYRALWRGLELGSDGIAFGDGPYVIKKLEGLDLPEVSNSDQSLTRAHGELDRPLDYMSSRDITMTLDVEALSAADREAALRALEATLLPAEDGSAEPMTLYIDGRAPVLVYTVPRRYERPIDFDYAVAFVAADAQIRWHCFDPLVYSEEEHVESCSRVTGGGGFDVPFTPPFTLDPATSGALIIPNDGPTRGHWTATLAAPLEQPIIEHLETGRRLAFRANGGVDLAGAQTLVVSSKDRSALLNGVSDRRTQLTVDSDFWRLEPGDNTFRLLADDGAGPMTVRGRDAFPA